MALSQIHNKLIYVIGMWESSLELYSEDEFLKKPSEDSWSVGQVYVHLVMGTIFFQIKQIEKCLSTDEFNEQKKTFPGKLAFFINSFPPIKIKIPPSLEYTPKQPRNKDEISKGIKILKNRVGKLVVELEHSSKTGKTKHPALGYLNKMEWFRLIEMHFRHHLRQKERLNKFLNNQR